MSSRKTVFLSLLAIIGLSTPAFAGQVGIEVVFTDREVDIIRAYYSDHASVERPKKGKGRGHRSLPPGIAKNLQRGKPLPPGIAKQVLPSRLIDLLGPPPRGFERIEMAGKILLVEVATQIVHDVLEDLILG